MGTTIVIATHKGGAAKTQTSLEFAVWLAKKGYRVCVIDTDSQANITDILLDGSTPKGRCLPEIIFDGHGIDPADIMCRDFGDGTSVDFICNNANAARLEARLPSNGAPKEYIMSDLIAQIKGKYDFVIIDTPPAAELMSMSSIIAADGVIIPALPDALSYEGVRSSLRIITTIQSSPRLNPSLKVLGIIVGRYHHTRINTEYIDIFIKDFGKLVLRPVVRECTRVQQAIKQRMPVLLFDSSCAAARDYSSAFENIKIL